MVVAAGNSSGYSTNRRASTVVPAAYDNVITVAAMNEYDGTGGGQGARTCLGSFAGPDDRFAPYSNYGPDVDIVAPGTCIRSTETGSGGTDTHLLTGTSQATPLVTGAVARYLADHPRHLARTDAPARACGRTSRLVPDLGSAVLRVDDTDAPNRVLDVAALEANDPDVRVWLSSQSLKVGGADTRRRVRVDLQRLGGWAGQAQLSLRDCPRQLAAPPSTAPVPASTGSEGWVPDSRSTSSARVRKGPQRI